MKSKMYTNSPRKPMMYGGMTKPKKAMMGGRQTPNMKMAEASDQAMGPMQRQVPMMYGGMSKKK